MWGEPWGAPWKGDWGGLRCGLDFEALVGLWGTLQPLEGVLDLGSQGTGRRDTGMPWGQRTCFPLPGIWGGGDAAAGSPPVPMVFPQKHGIPCTLSTHPDPFNTEFTPFLCPCLPPMREETGGPGCPVGCYSHGIFTGIPVAPPGSALPLPGAHPHPGTPGRVLSPSWGSCRGCHVQVGAPSWGYLPDDP